MKIGDYFDITRYVASLSDENLWAYYVRFQTPYNELEQKCKAAAFDELQYRSRQGKLRLNCPLDRI